MIDTHLHIWQLERGWYGWNTPVLGAVHADSAIEDVGDDLVTAGVEGVVVVQAADTLAETGWLLSVAEADPRLGGVVGYLPLAEPDAVPGLLRTYAGRPLVGIRQLWHAHDDPGELADPAVLDSLRLLGDAGLPVDVPDAWPRLWPALADAVRAAARTTFVLDHAGKPPFGDHDAWPRWEDDLRALAANPNVVIKLSGLFGGSGSTIPATATELARVVRLVREIAGPDRIMIGSDWPMIRGSASYAGSLARLRGLLADWTDAELGAALTGTAARVYRPWSPADSGGH